MNIILNLLWLFWRLDLCRVLVYVFIADGDFDNRNSLARAAFNIGLLTLCLLFKVVDRQNISGADIGTGILGLTEIFYGFILDGGWLSFFILF